MSLLGQFGMLATRNAAVSAIVVGSGAVGLVTLGLAIRPPIALSGSTAIVAATDGLSAERSDMVREFKRLIASTHAVINARTPDDGSVNLVLWMNDTRDQGVVNEDEVLLVTYTPLLRVITALTAPPQDSKSPEVDTSMLFSDTLSADWRRRSDIQQSVIATDVTGVAIEPIAQDPDEVTLRIRLTFSNHHPDEKKEHRAHTMFVITKPAVVHQR